MEQLYKLYFKDKNEYEKIYKERFESENSMHFNFKINNHDAFFYFHKDINSLIFNINQLDKKITKLLEELPNVSIMSFKRKSLIDEILNTNEIEGVISTRKEIGEIISDIEKQAKGKDNRIKSLVHKYYMLNDEDYSILTLEGIRNAYNELVLDEIDTNNYPDGKLFRKELAYVYKNEKQIHTGVYPEDKINLILSNALELLNDQNIDLLIRTSIFHYIFSFVHPFYDGNGRLDRYISSLYLKKYYNPIISYRLSLSIKDNLKKYYDAFSNTNSKYNCGDITTFVYEFLNIIKSSFESTIESLEMKKEEYNEIINVISNYELSKDKILNNKLINLLQILIQADIFGEPALSKYNLNKITNYSLPTITKYLNILCENEYVIQEMNNNEYIYYFNNNSIKY